MMMENNNYQVAQDGAYYGEEDLQQQDLL